MLTEKKRKTSVVAWADADESAPVFAQSKGHGDLFFRALSVSVVN